MRIVSYYKSLGPDQQTAGGIGQGGGLYWQEAVGRLLQMELARILKADGLCYARPHGRDSFDRQDYDVADGDFDIAYCQLFEVPRKRPARWVYSIISDYIGMEALLEDFLTRARPNLLISFQYPLVPPPGRPNLVTQCEAHNCRVVFLPWFNVSNEPIWLDEKDVAGMCSGKMGGTYPNRDAIYKYLETLGRSDILLSGNPHGSTFRLSDEQYQSALRRCRYYFSGGIYDIQIPPKYYEVLNYGACLVSHELPMMAEVGLVPNETYLRIRSVQEIPAILDSDRWRDIGKRGQRLAHERHNMTARAVQIAEIYRESQETA